ncbi:hypothetical protein BMT54_10725 [Pasteurellaceae bacterium 15-036681]|nr:hypothetical protein BMT54_10725 [Pasteurellaceae bacterium 15-036681]
MNRSNLALKLKNFRAISEASINLNGITVVSGINGSGKSTLSKILYYFFKITSDFEGEVRKNLQPHLSHIGIALEYLLNSIPVENRPFSTKDISTNFHNRSTNDKKIIQTEENLSAFIDKLEIYFSNQEEDNIKNNIDTVKKFLLDEQTNANLFEKLKERIHFVFQKIEQDLEERPSYYITKEINNLFNTNQNAEQLDIFESNNILFSNKNNHVLKSLFINNSIYIDTPMALESFNTQNGYWSDLNQHLKKRRNSQNNELTKIISQEILEADIELDNQSVSDNRLVYKRNLDNLILDLQECATGIKALGIIQQLIKNGTINDKTLLIIDEPEVHLHPQWIVEYARILVLIRKYIGCHIFISSHSPDMVQAIRYISERYELLDDLNFYLACEHKQTKQFVYKELNHDIEPIFECFNVSLEKIDSYALND